MAFNPSERKRKNSLTQPPDMSKDPLLNKRDSEVRMVLLGKTGSGKSSTGNTILRENKFDVNVTFQHVTKECVRVYRPVNGRMVWVIDTPGLFDGVMTEDEMKVQLEKAVDMLYPGVHVFLLVMRLDVRFTGEEQNTVKWIVENFGKEIQKHIIVLFTHRNVLQERSIEQHLDLNPLLKGVVESMAGYHVFENKNDDDETQVPELLEKIDDVKKNNGNQIYTREMYSEVQRKRQQGKYIEYAGVTGAVGVAAIGVAAAARSGDPVITGAAAALAMGAIAWALGKIDN